MKYVLYYTLPDDPGNEHEEEHDCIHDMQQRKDQLLAMPWLCELPDIYAADQNGNEVYLK